MEETYEQYQRTENNQGTADQASESVVEKGRSEPETAGSKEKGQVSEPLQGDLFNANPKNEKQLELFPTFAGSGKKHKASGNKSGVKTDSKGKSSGTQGGVKLAQSQRIGVKTTGYVQHRGLAVKSDAHVETFI